MYRPLSCFLFLLSCGASFSQYIFPGCEVQHTNDNNGYTEMRTEKDTLKILLNSRFSTLEVRVQVGATDISVKNVPILQGKWSIIQVNLKDEVQIIAPNNSVYTSKDNQTALTRYPIKKVKVFKADTVTNCPQGLPFKKISSHDSFPFLGEERKDEIYILYPMMEMTVEFGFHSVSRYLCWNREDRQIVMKNDKDCPPLPGFQYYWIQFHFENEQVKVMSENKREIGNLLSIQTEAQVWFFVEAEEDLFVVQCLQKNCEPLIPSDDMDTDTPTTEGNVELLPNAESKTWSWILPTVILMLVVLAWIIDCLLRNHQMNKLQQAEHYGQSCSVTFRNTAHSSTNSEDDMVSLMRENCKPELQ